MEAVNRKESWYLLIGDVVVFVLSLWFSLAIRYGSFPSRGAFLEHLIPFSILFIIWCLIFFIAGLYEKHTVVFKKHLPFRILKTQVINSFLAVVFFYFIPYFGITPKIVLFIYIVISLGLIFAWRNYGSKIFGLKVREPAMILGRGPELQALLQEINSNSRYGLEFVSIFDLDRVNEIDLQKEVVDKVNSNHISVVVIDTQNENFKKNLSSFYSLLFSRVRFVDICNLYEEIFDRVPLSLISYDWFLENVSFSVGLAYRFLKRVIDLSVALILGLVSLIFYPFIFVGIKIDDQGPIFISQERIGKSNKLVKIKKFRTMSFNDNEQDKNKTLNHVTKFGLFLRKSRLDELPQLWNVLRGDLSLIGPRPELPALAKIYEKEIPYYNVRHLISPGLSGWAQLYHENHPHHGANIEETKNKLSYDLFYVKNRSLGLDIKIALKTIKTLLSRSGR